MTYGEKAEELFRSGCNCTQAVVLAFSDVTGLDRRTAMLASGPFGGGIGRMREVCGTVSGMAMVAGLLGRFDTAGDNDAKAALYATVREMSERFKKEAGGSMICRELLSGGPGGVEVGGAPEARTAEYYAKRPCPKLAHLAADIAAEVLLGHREMH